MRIKTTDDRTIPRAASLRQKYLHKKIGVAWIFNNPYYFQNEKLINLPDQRLNARYYQLVKAHMQNSPTIAAGPVIPIELEESFVATQATWSFFPMNA